jgi:glucose/arabinose dehydrogenase
MNPADRLRRAFAALLAAAAGVTASAFPADGAAAPVRAQGAPVVSVITTGLTVPWDIAFLPDGRALVTERTGAVRIVAADGRLSPTPAARLTVTQNGEGGLLGVALDPAFSAGQPFVYLTATVGSEMQVQRWRMTGDTLVRDGVVIGGILMGSIHSSGRVRFGPDGALYVGTGDAGYGPRSQDLSVLNGKVLRVPPGAFRGARVTPEIHAVGLRNPQGFAWQPGSGRFFSTDHGPSVFDGPSGDDELDLIVPGGNYGWPFVYGADHGSWIAPAHLWPTTIAPSGLEFVTLPGSSWTNKALVAGLRGQVLRLLTFSGARVVDDEPLLQGVYGRLRAVTEAPDGAIWVTTSNRDGRGDPAATDDRILRIVPPAGVGDPLGDGLALDAAIAPAPALAPRPAPAARGLLTRLVAPKSARVGRAVRIRLVFRAVPSGPVVLQQRLASGRWTTLRLVRPRSRNLVLALRPKATGRLVLRVRHRHAARAVDRKIVLNVRR